MKRTTITVVAIVSVLFVALGLTYVLTGTGGFKRMVTISGIYSLCKPDGYEVVCFLDADGKEGGMSCLPLSAAGGVCDPKHKITDH